MKNNILIITGGTGGHVIPAVHFFKYVDSKNKEVNLLTDKRGSKFINGINKNKIYKITSSHLSGNIFFKFKGIIKLFIGCFQSFKILIKLKPKVIVSFGSYASLTPLICFMFLRFFFRTTLYLHEQNSIVGQTNKIFIKFSNKIFMHFSNDYKDLKKFSEKILITGLPQKNFFDANLNHDTTNNNINFKFLVFAGSQGSIDILNIFKKIIYELKTIPNLKKIEFIIQCPLIKQEEIINLLIENNFDYKIKNFFKNFENTLSKVNIALCRSGAGTINDLIKFKIPAIICPLPNAKDNHQFENAKILSNAKCAIIVNKEKINIDKIKLFIKKVIYDKDFNKSLLDKFSKLKSSNASELMWKYIEDDQKK
jgi:UDP-N-acetylglucosamine--N-acetylmuramyl-(pentapeptide) pyrophosphoryl-undecaprenol N-acetylglucosamine transferase